MYTWNQKTHHTQFSSVFPFPFCAVWIFKCVYHPTRTPARSFARSHARVTKRETWKNEMYRRQKRSPISHCGMSVRVIWIRNFDMYIHAYILFTSCSLNVFTRGEIEPSTSPKPMRTVIKRHTEFGIATANNFGFSSRVFFVLLSFTFLLPSLTL